MNGRFGASITIADLNTDGLNDLVVSAPYVGALDLTYQVLQAMLLQYSWGFGILGSTQPCCWPLKKTWKMYKYVDYISFQGRVYIYFGQEIGTISVEPQTIISCEVLSDLTIHFLLFCIFIKAQKIDRLHV